ncbi:DUF6489 family protein [Sphingomonas arantia]|uniref:DUF6489 family protein n=1 Tax=Sphingomonas arantia TaxID=1460676 RepID=A0ABW4TU09_9SPHN
MKITVDVDCTPQEARAFMGLPDLEPLHAAYLDKMKRNIDEGITPDSLQAMLKSWAPMGEAGLMLWKQLSDQMGKASTRK